MKLQNSLLPALLLFLAAACPTKASVIWDLTPFSGDQIGMRIVVEQDALPNTLRITANVLPSGGNTVGDIRGIFFNVEGGSSGITQSMFSAVNFPLTTTQDVCIGTGITSCGAANNNLNGGPNGLLPQGSFHVGIEVGAQGIGNGDDYQVATILFNYGALGLTPGSIGPFGARVMSVGSGSNRGGSAKLYSGLVPVVPDTETPIPEPATWVMMGAGLCLAGLLRRRRVG